MLCSGQQGGRQATMRLICQMLTLLAIALPAAPACINATSLSRVVVINMPHRTDRMKFMAKHLQRLAREVPYERFPGQTVSATEAGSLLPPWMATAFTRERLIGTAGCLKSKLLVLRDFLASWQASGRPDELLLLLEDDYLIASPRNLKQLLSAHLTESLGSGAMVCRPQLVRLDCWADDSLSSDLGACNAAKVVSRCKCGGTHAMVIPTWGMDALIKLYESRIDEADCALAHLPSGYCLNAGIMSRHPRYWVNDIPKGK